MSARIEVRKVGFWSWEARIVESSRPEPKHDSGVWEVRRGTRSTSAPRSLPEEGLYGFTRARATRAARRWLKSEAETPWEPA